MSSYKTVIDILYNHKLFNLSFMLNDELLAAGTRKHKKNKKELGKKGKVKVKV